MPTARGAGARAMSATSPAGRGRQTGRKTRQSALPSFRSCSIVSTSGTLLGSALGPAIDAAAAVIRLGLGPTKGFENDVGRRTNVRCLGLGFVEVPRNVSKADVHAVLADFRGHMLWQNILLPCHRVALGDLAACYPEAKHYTVDYRAAAGMKRQPSSGIVAIDALLRNRVCGTMRLFGFETTPPGPDVPDHYFRQLGAQMSEIPAMRKYNYVLDHPAGHNSRAEHAWLTRMSSTLNSSDITAGRQIREITLRALLRAEQRADPAPLGSEKNRTIRRLGGLSSAKNQPIGSTCDYRQCPKHRSATEGGAAPRRVVPLRPAGHSWLSGSRAHPAELVRALRARTRPFVVLRGYWSRGKTDEAHAQVGGSRPFSLICVHQLP